MGDFQTLWVWGKVVYDYVLKKAFINHRSIWWKSESTLCLDIYFSSLYFSCIPRAFLFAIRKFCFCRSINIWISTRRKHLLQFSVCSEFFCLSLQIEWPWHCERRCKKVPTDLNRNLILLAGDRMVAANCDLAENANTGTAIWSGQKDQLRHHKKAILMASCTEIYIDENHFADR